MVDAIDCGGDSIECSAESLYSWSIDKDDEFDKMNILIERIPNVLEHIFVGGGHLRSNAMTNYSESYNFSSSNLGNRVLKATDSVLLVKDIESSAWEKFKEENIWENDFVKHELEIFKEAGLAAGSFLAGDEASAVEHGMSALEKAFNFPRPFDDNNVDSVPNEAKLRSNSPGGSGYENHMSGMSKHERRLAEDARRIIEGMEAYENGSGTIERSEDREHGKR